MLTRDKGYRRMKKVGKGEGMAIVSFLISAGSFLQFTSQ